MGFHISNGFSSVLSIQWHDPGDSDMIILASASVIHGIIKYPLAESWTMWSHLSGHLGDVSGLGIWKWSVVICGRHKQTCWMFPELFTSCHLAFVPFLSLSIHFLHRFCIRQDMLEEGIGVMALVWMGNPHHSPPVLRHLCGNSPLF